MLWLADLFFLLTPSVFMRMMCRATAWLLLLLVTYCAPTAHRGVNESLAGEIGAALQLFVETASTNTSASSAREGAATAYRCAALLQVKMNTADMAHRPSRICTRARASARAVALLLVISTDMVSVHTHRPT